MKDQTGTEKKAISFLIKKGKFNVRQNLAQILFKRICKDA